MEPVPWNQELSWPKQSERFMGPHWEQSVLTGDDPDRLAWLELRDLDLKAAVEELFSIMSSLQILQTKEKP